jgi:hypothetical protein
VAAKDNGVAKSEEMKKTSVSIFWLKSRNSAETVKTRRIGGAQAKYRQMKNQ